MILALALADPTSVSAGTSAPSAAPSSSPSSSPTTSGYFGSDFLRFIGDSLDESGNLQGASFLSGSGSGGPAE